MKRILRIILLMILPMLYFNIYVWITTLSSDYRIVDIGSFLWDVLFGTFMLILVYWWFVPLLIFAVSVEYMYNLFHNQTSKKFYIYAALIGILTFIIKILFESGAKSIILNPFYFTAVPFIIYLLATLSVYGLRNLFLHKQ